MTQLILHRLKLFIVVITIYVKLFYFTDFHLRNAGNIKSLQIDTLSTLIRLYSILRWWEGFDMNVIKALIEGKTQDLIVFLVEDREVIIEEAMKLVYNSAIFEKLSNPDTGLYRERVLRMFMNC